MESRKINTVISQDAADALGRIKQKYNGNKTAALNAIILQADKETPMQQRNLTAEEITVVVNATPTPDSEAMQAAEVWQCGNCGRVYEAWRYSGSGRASVGCGCKAPHEWPAQYSLTVSPGNYTT